MFPIYVAIYLIFGILTVNTYKMLLDHFKINKKVSIDWKILISVLWIVIVPLVCYRWVLIPLYDSIKRIIKRAIRKCKIKLKCIINKEFKEVHLKTGKAFNEGLKSISNINPYNLEINPYEHQGWNWGKQAQNERG